MEEREEEGRRKEGKKDTGKKARKKKGAKGFGNDSIIESDRSVECRFRSRFTEKGS